MLTCKEQVARSSDYLDGQLTFRERLLVRHHLLFCPNCRRFIRQMRLMQATLRIMPDEPVKDADVLAERLAAERRKDL
ncbi:zf-HC2 domain-containing protein [Pseudomonas fluorescens]|uniref:Zf-HC2 domain-containing protein n=1 Tax=Pseudomonas fluorescens TaxID=294 RepID=A0AAE2PW67_PSEFL|nr:MULTISPECIES: zf-HC2 domain-containing protein [Pseudomonas fluorescens group]MBA1428555.1 anti-sigma factor [Pseudomonas orientalis]MBD8150722.1 zf-HC2 domain-containing protein [Pseudomonas fluorescens]MBD8176781.1 zf-HC2 domain-containing protein [Pseudomonas fluorescens]MBD8269280.1 zf-HC2 domain-containing protein [Pseudomonas fluorescens]MBD8745639.1 zf-HC2 domain-containing protein [Pseudomonas fluorescens]